jgi:clan AA aspartic protease (TIGR02281 family)
MRRECKGFFAGRHSMSLNVSSCVAFLMLSLGSGIFLVSQPIWAITYQCVDSSGRSMFTDSPPQEERCALVHQGNPMAPVYPVQPLPSPKRNHEQVEAMAPDAAVAAQPPGQITVPVFRVGQTLVVQARLNGSRDATLIVDTSAKMTVLSIQVARDAGISPSSYISTVTLNIAGNPVRANFALLDTIAVGAAEVPQVPVAVHDLSDAPSGVDGLLGLSFLSRFFVKLDAQKGELHLRPR